MTAYHTGFIVQPGLLLIFVRNFLLASRSLSDEVCYLRQLQYARNATLSQYACLIPPLLVDFEQPWLMCHCAWMSNKCA